MAHARHERGGRTGRGTGMSPSSTSQLSFQVHLTVLLSPDPRRPPRHLPERRPATRPLSFGRVRCHLHRLRLEVQSSHLQFVSEAIRRRARQDTVFYNTMSRSKEPFAAVRGDDVVRFYSCGPTVYDYAHVGNFRAFLTYDIIKRWLQFCGYRVRHVTNLTDVDDKIIQRMHREQRSAADIADDFTRAFFADLELLNVVPAEVYPRATHHIDDMVALIRRLLDGGYAYERDGSVYFAVDKFDTYGRLGRLDFQGMLSAAEVDATHKHDPRDFAMWKAHRPEDGAVRWDTGLGCGRPGWHIECSAMAMRYLGESIDIHAGGVDLVFPHHENEIAQSEAATGRPFARFWLHNGFVNIDGEKMSKSLGNFVTLRDVARTALQARAFRYLIVSSQYRSGVNFTEEALKAACSAVKRLDAFRAQMIALSAAAAPTGPTSVDGECQELADEFCRHMADDLNTPRAAATLFEMLRRFEARRRAGTLEANDAAVVVQLLDDLDRVMGIFYRPAAYATEEEQGGAADGTGHLPDKLRELVELRTAARAAKDFARADRLRQEIGKLGFAVKDTPHGPQLSRIAE
ncbi:hypothetical protein CDCA_CDCA12G3406 [Cyanidium caldarium]|uniref:Cysteine--tRNA ligase n=1 Tax=Cyanidium caldarium TaxID=2771 RepID=A0AAV9IZ25_CYACA|nr:hypothetical protein CDCA_CDCA12G3406 [Cyanidium caldarium]